MLAIINQSSGSVPPDAEAQLTAALGGLGASAKIVRVEAGSMKQTMADVDERHDPVIVWGGDGTIACALNHMPEGTNILPLPGGTMNVLHERVHGSFETWEDVLGRALKTDARFDLHAGRAGNRRFFVGAIGGHLAQLAAAREAIREGDFLAAAGTLVDPEVMDLDTHIEFRFGGSNEPQRLAAAFAAMVPHAEGSAFEIASVAPQSMFDAARIAAASLLDGWREAEDVVWDFEEGFTITDRTGADIPCTFDGELRTVPSGTVFTLERHAARVVSAAQEVP